MPKIIIDQAKCKGCLLCISFCPKGLISQNSSLNKHGVKPVKFSRQVNLTKGGIPPPAKAGSRQCREKAGNKTSDCLGCMMCALICPDCCIEVYK